MINYPHKLKGYLDRLIAFLLILLFLPLILGLALALYFQNSGQPFFLQERPGLNGRIFTIVKFKTMSDLKDPLGNLLPDVQRITKLGKLIRKYSLDELLQLFNVLSGDMSLVGPRPLLKNYLVLYTAEQMRRHEVRPGMTGLAQVEGRNLLSWEEKFKLDVFYVDNVSFLLDMKILLKTIFVVLMGRGVHSDKSYTPEPFTGSVK